MKALHSRRWFIFEHPTKRSLGRCTADKIVLSSQRLVQLRRRPEELRYGFEIYDKMAWWAIIESGKVSVE
jgi:hypothetical protein